MAKHKLRALLIDLNGTLHVGHDPTPGAVKALEKLRKSKLPFIFCSNSTKESSESLRGKLRDIGLIPTTTTTKQRQDEEQLLTSLGACKLLVEERGLRNPLLLMSPSAKEEFSSLSALSSSSEAEHDSVILGLHEPSLSYDQLNLAFRVLKGEPLSVEGGASETKKSKTVLIAPHASLYLQAPRTSSLPAGLSLGIGPFVRALEEAADVKAEIVGKPTYRFFNLALDTLKTRYPDLKDIKAEEVGVIGDDVVNDLGQGAVQAGFKRFLVKTGKYREGAETIDKENPPSDVYKTFADFVEDLAME